MTDREIAILMVPFILEVVERGESSITYLDLTEKVNERFGLKLNPHVDTGGPLGELQMICEAHGAPCLPAMVVRKDTGKPGGGFAEPYRELHPLATGMDDDEILVMEREKIRTYKHWQDLLDDLGIDYQYGGGNGNPLSPAAAQKYYEYIVKKCFVEETELVKRNRKARQKCLELQGTTCKVCGFNSMEMYGIPGIIHVHHVDPVADMDDTREVDPEVDLVPLCPNCHALVHSKKRDTKGGYPKEDVYTIDEARAMWQAAQDVKDPQQ